MQSQSWLCIKYSLVKWEPLLYRGPEIKEQMTYNWIQIKFLTWILHPISHPSIHLLLIIQFSIIRRAEPIPAVTSQHGGYTGGQSVAGLMHRDRQPFTTPRTSFDWRRKLEYSEGTHTDMWPTCKLPCKAWIPSPDSDMQTQHHCAKVA